VADLRHDFVGRVTTSYHVLLVASTGGHLAQLLELESWWRRLRRTWVTFDKADARSALAGEDVVYAHHPTTRNVPNAIRNLALAHRVVRDRRPDLVFSTGAGVALPFFVAAKCRAIPTVYLEVYDRVESRTLTGRLCRPLSSAFCVQWPEQLALYPGAECVGAVL
jgi:UDP-N-acetylglucosamine:LPS N-acetylglucosamine transferase